MGEKIIESTFEDGDDGWTTKPNHSGALQDQGDGNHYLGWSSGQEAVKKYVAPGEFLGDDSQWFGSFLQFDLLDTGANPENQGDLTLFGKGGQSFHAILNLTSTTWAHFQVQLSTDNSTGYVLFDQDGRPATDMEVKEVLSDVTKITLEGHYSSSGGDAGGLDNFQIEYHVRHHTHGSAVEPTTAEHWL